MSSLGPLKSKRQSIKTFLERLIWPPKLEARKIYSRLHDDHDGTGVGHLHVIIGDDGDAWVQIPDTRDGLRFRTFAGGGSSLNTRNALLILAEAIRLDNEESK